MRFFTRIKAACGAKPRTSTQLEVDLMGEHMRQADELEADRQTAANPPSTVGAKIRLGVVFVAGATAASVALLAAYFATREQPKPDSFNPNDPCVRNTTGVVTAYAGNSTFNATTGWVSPVLFQVAQWTCRELICNASAIAELMAITTPRCRNDCNDYPRNLTVSQCTSIEAAAMLALVQTSCEVGVRNTLTLWEGGTDNWNGSALSTAEQLVVRLTDTPAEAPQNLTCNNC